MKKITILFAILSIILVTACSMNVHTVGNGAQGNQITQARQWYILYGLIPLNDVDTKEMVGSTSDYEIQTAQQPMDIIMNLFTSYISVTSRTVTVKK